MQAVNLCDSLTNPRLKANIYANMGGLYHTTGKMLRAKEFMEKAYRILTENNLQYTADSVTQICNYASLAANSNTSPWKMCRAYYPEYDYARRAFGKYGTYILADERYGQGKRKIKAVAEHLFRSLGRQSRTHGTENIGNKRTDIFT